MKRQYSRILLLLLICCGTNSKTPSVSPSDLVTNYLQALKTNDENTALSCWTIKEAPMPPSKKNLALAALKMGLLAEKRLVMNADYKIINEKVEDEVATVTVQRAFLPQNEVTNIKVRLIVDDGLWKISQWGIR